MLNEPKEHYEITGQVWQDENGNYSYYVAQAFDESGDDHEILAYGEDANWDHACKEIFKTIAMHSP